MRGTVHILMIRDDVWFVAREPHFDRAVLPNLVCGPVSGIDRTVSTMEFLILGQCAPLFVLHLTPIVQLCKR